MKGFFEKLRNSQGAHAIKDDPSHMIGVSVGLVEGLCRLHIHMHDDAIVQRDAPEWIAYDEKDSEALQVHTFVRSRNACQLRMLPTNAYDCQETTQTRRDLLIARSSPCRMGAVRPIDWSHTSNRVPSLRRTMYIFKHLISWWCLRSKHPVPQ